MNDDTLKSEARTASRFRISLPGLDSNLSLFAGLLVTAGLPPYRWTWPLVPVGLAILFVVMVRTRRPARAAWFFALAHQGALLHWLFLLDPSKSIPTRALVPIQAILTVLYVSVFYLVVGWVFRLLRDRLGALRALLILPVLWAVMETARSHGEMAFSWCLVGSAVVGSPLMSLVRAAGELGAGVGLVFAAVLVAAWRTNGPGGKRPVLMTSVAGAVGFWAFLILGSMASPEGTQAVSRTEPVRVAAVQADVALKDKWQDARIDSTRVPYSQLTEAAADDRAEFIVWAETAVPAYVRLEPDLLAWLRGVVRDANRYLYTGFPDADRGPDGAVRTFNSSGLFSPQGALLDTYAKHHLLPIGEAMPFSSYLPFLANLDVGQAEWTPGPRPVPMTVSLPDGDFRFSGMICFESVFSWLARHSVAEGSQCLVVITNDGWFGESAGPRQHTALARLRAVECGVPVIRSANNGISFICDERGRILDRLDLGQRGFVVADIVPGSGRTLYVRYGSMPLVLMLALWTLLVLFAPWLKPRSNGGSP